MSKAVTETQQPEVAAVPATEMGQRETNLRLHRRLQGVEARLEEAERQQQQMADLLVLAEVALGAVVDRSRKAPDAVETFARVLRGLAGFDRAETRFLAEAEAKGFINAGTNGGDGVDRAKLEDSVRRSLADARGTDDQAMEDVRVGVERALALSGAQIAGDIASRRAMSRPGVRPY